MKVYVVHWWKPGANLTGVQDVCESPEVAKAWRDLHANGPDEKDNVWAVTVVDVKTEPPK